MKRVFCSLLLATISINLYAQNCKGYYYLSNGSVEMTIYDKKGKESGKAVYNFSDVNNTGNTTSANFSVTISDEKGKTLSTSSGKYKCAGGVLYMDARVAFPQEQMAAYKDMEVRAPEVFIEYPATLSAGQSLSAVSIKMEMYNKGALHSTTSFDQSNRKVVAKETITTPAGTFECWKITYDARLKASIAPMNIGVPFNFKGTEWFAPHFGIVKTETHNKNGKLIGSTMISKK